MLRYLISQIDQCGHATSHCVLFMQTTSHTRHLAIAVSYFIKGCIQSLTGFLSPIQVMLQSAMLFHRLYNTSCETKTVNLFWFITACVWSVPFAAGMRDEHGQIHIHSSSSLSQVEKFITFFPLALFGHVIYYMCCTWISKLIQ